MELQNIVYKSENLIIQRLQWSPRGIVVIVGSGYSLSVDNNDKITFIDPFFIPPTSNNNYGKNCNVYTIYFTKNCAGLAVAGKELAYWINTFLLLNRKIILHGRSKCGCCFVNLCQWLTPDINTKVSLVTVSAPFRGTPFADIKNFSQKLNAFEKFLYFRVFSNHHVDRDISPGSNFIKSLNMESINVNYCPIVSKCGPTANPIDWLLWLVDILTGIHGDGIVPLESQIPDNPYDQITASHATSMRKSCKFVRKLIEE